MLLISSIINFLEDLTFFVTSKDFLNDANRLIVLWMPWLEFTFQFLDDSIVIEDFILESEEFTEPGFTYNFTIHSSLESFFSKLEVFGFVSEGSNGSLHGSDEIACTVTLKGVSSTLFSVPHELDDRVLETTGFEGHDWCATYEELMLHNTSWFES